MPFGIFPFTVLIDLDVGVSWTCACFMLGIWNFRGSFSVLLGFASFVKRYPKELLGFLLVFTVVLLNY